MSSLQWHHRPALRRPVLLAGFEGWNDAGDAASGAIRWLADRFDAELIAKIDAEEFFDFTTTRPIVSTNDDGEREITWPDTELWAATTETDRDLVLLLGPEPHLRWRTYASAVAEAARTLDCSLVLTLGALLADVPHTFPTRVSGTTDDPVLAQRLGLVRNDYEGPTGIVGALHVALAEGGQRAASLWATVPNYVSGAPSPKATLALVERTLTILGIDRATTDLEIATASYERQLDELIADDEDTAAYVADLESSMQGLDDEDDDDQDLASTDPATLVEEVERFLRGEP